MFSLEPGRRLGPDLLAQAMVAALGGCNFQLVEVLLEETQALIDDYSGSLKVPKVLPTK